jgi:acyl-CoA thioester hydrolase
MPEQSLYSTSVDIRFSDEDNMGHVHHEAIVGYIAHARVTFVDDLVKRSGVPDIDYVLVNLNVDFLAEVNHPGMVDVSSWVERIGSKSVTTKYELFKNGEIFARATSVNVFFNTRTKETVPIPDALGAILSDHMAPNE